MILRDCPYPCSTTSDLSRSQCMIPKMMFFKAVLYLRICPIWEDDVRAHLAYLDSIHCLLLEPLTNAMALSRAGKRIRRTLRLAHTVPVRPAWFLGSSSPTQLRPWFHIPRSLLEHSQEIRPFAEAITNRAGIDETPFSRATRVMAAPMVTKRGVATDFAPDLRCGRMPLMLTSSTVHDGVFRSPTGE